MSGRVDPVARPDEDDPIEVQQGVGEPGRPGPAAALTPDPPDDAGGSGSLADPGDVEVGPGGAAPPEADAGTDPPADG